MRLIILKFFLTAICVAFTLGAWAQSGTSVCTGSLGDPVINQNFGSGSNPGAPLAAGITNMTYTTDNCPEDGFYTIASSVGNCYSSAWHNVTTDHTGNPNGYMMIVNASYDPSIFFTQTANGLCPNTTYEFSAYILNLITLAASGTNNKQPNITFSIETLDGQVLQTANTGTLAPTNDIHWYNEGVFFTTPANVTDVVVKMTNNAPGGNGNDLILDDITFRACGPVIQAGFTSVDGPEKKDLCFGNSGTYNLTANVADNNTHQYQWQSYNNNNWQDIPNSNSKSFNVTLTNPAVGTYQYRVGVGNGSDISSVDCRVYSAPLAVTVDPLPVVPAIPPQTLCEGSQLQLTASGGSTYVWSGPGISNSTQNPLIVNNVSLANAGTYSVTVTSAAGCAAAPVQTTVKVTPKIVPVVGNGLSVCAGVPAQLTASGGLYYKWTPSTGLDHDDIANPVATPSQTTTYNVAVSNDACTDNSKSVTVTVLQPPVANGGGDKKIFEGQSVTLNGTDKGDEITSVYWSPATFLSDPNSLTPVASPTDDITYTLTVVSQNCNLSTSTVFVRVYKKITIPNTFSPNNDGRNDTWDIDALSTYPESTITIFDRYGRTVYQGTGYSKSWNGTYNGSLLPPATYYYIIDLKNYTPKIAGWVQLIR